MARKIVLFLLIILYPSIVLGQQADQKVADKNFAMINGFMFGATIFNTEVTFLAIKKCPGCMGLDPTTQPSIGLDKRLAVYGMLMMLNGNTALASYKLKENKNRYWWLAPVAVGTIASVMGGMNMRFVF